MLGPFRQRPRAGSQVHAPVRYAHYTAENRGCKWDINELYCIYMKVKARRAKPAPHVPGSSKLLGALGCKVRALRAARGLTRRELAARSGLSERFLARIESGSGNISLLHFAALARALDISASELLQEASRPAGSFIALLGLRGAGKSTIGAALAKRLRLPFFELDSLIEEEAGLSLSQIFEMHGERYYRRLEKEALVRLLASAEPGVLAAGGGIVTDPQTAGPLSQEPGEHGETVQPERIVSAVDQHPLLVAVARQVRPPAQTVHRVGGNGEARLHLDGQQPIAEINEEVNFVPRRVAPEEKRRLPAGVLESLDDLAGDERLEDGPTQRVTLEHIGAVDTQQVARQPRVQKVQPRALPQALAEAGVVGRQERHDEADAQGRQPLPGGGLADTGVLGEGREVQLLSRPRRDEPHEPLECVEVEDPEDVPQVSLDIGPVVIGQPAVRRQVLVVDPRVEAGPEGRPQLSPGWSRPSRQRAEGQRIRRLATTQLGEGQG